MDIKKIIALVSALVGLILLGTGLSSAATSSANKITPKSQVLKILKKYNNSAAVDIDIQRTETKKTLGTSTTSEGELVYSKNRIYFVTEQPTKTEIIYNKSVWVIEYPDLELDENGNRKVSMFDAAKAPFIKTMAQVFSAPESLLGKDATITQNEDEITVKLNKVKDTNLKELAIALNAKEQVIKNISFIDDLETSSVMTFEKTQFLKTEPKNKFTYKKQKTDEILKP